MRASRLSQHGRNRLIFTCYAISWAIAIWLPSGPAFAARSDSGEEQAVRLDAGQLLELAERGQKSGDFSIAEAADRAGIAEPVVEEPSEARIRLPNFLMGKSGWIEGAVTLSDIPDEKK